MIKLIKSHQKLTLDGIEQFETENKVKLSENYIKFLLKWNGGKPRPGNELKIEGHGERVLNAFNGIDDMYDDLTDIIDIYEYRLLQHCMPIGDDPGGNAILLGTLEPHDDHIYFWDHENESDLDEPDMSNMYFLADNIWRFLDHLYEEE